MIIREAVSNDLAELMVLYTQLGKNNRLESNAQALSIWQEILSDVNHYVIVGEEDGNIVSTCVLVVVPNLTHQLRPYALIENVVTREDARGKGYAGAILEYAKAIAMGKSCYKLMLLTGSKERHVHHFYEKAGYNRLDKTAYIQWL